MPPASAVQGISHDTDREFGVSLWLGTEYERKKQRLLQELQLDYKQYISKKKDVKISYPRPTPPLGLSLPIDEKLSAKEKLKEERNKEYNLFLQEKAQNRHIKRRTPSSFTSTVQSPDVGHVSPPAAPLPVNTYRNAPTPQPARPSSRRDAATLTETVVEGRKGRKTWDRRERLKRRWLIYRPVELCSSEEETFTEDEEKEEVDFGRRRKNIENLDPEGKEERRRKEGKDKRSPHGAKEVAAPSVQDQNNNDLHLRSDPTKPDNMKATKKSSPGPCKDKTQFATGLQIGATEELVASQRRKEQYKRELLKQMEEEQRNKMREKTLELRVAATGATDPEKKPDRIKHFGAVNQNQDGPYALGTNQKAEVKLKNHKPPDDTELRGSTEKPESVSGPGHRVHSLDYLNEDYHRDLSNMLKEVTIPRVAAGAPPPVPPTVTNNYTTPYDSSYYYYGGRNPLDPSSPQRQNDVTGPTQGSASSPEEPPPPRPSHHSELAEQGNSTSPAFPGDLSAEVESKRKRETALSYQEALKQQIKERLEQRRREKEERERYDAKIEAEMTAYNPWGRSGGGAPIKDLKGHIFSDLSQMHRINEETFKNPGVNDAEQTLNSPKTSGETPAPEVKAVFSQRLSGLSDSPNPQQLHTQDRYKEELKLQIEENRRKQAEEREQMRMEEEKEERRLAQQRIRIQQEYEEEQGRQRKIKNKLEIHGWINDPKPCRQEEQKVEKQQEEEEEEEEERRERTAAPCSRSREEKTHVNYKTLPSPPVPALRTKQPDLVASRPASSVSQLSSRTVSRRSVSAPHYPSAPATTPPPQDGHREVIRQLSTLRRYLRSEQRQLEGQMGKSDPKERLRRPPNRSRRRPTVESPHSETEQPSSAETYSVPGRVNMKNIREFNLLKYRDTTSRGDVLHMFPDPPTDDQSLDIQQRALLREQRRKLRLLRREEDDADLLDLRPRRYCPRTRAERSALPSETAFIDIFSDDPREQQHQQQQQQHQQRRSTPSSSSEPQRRSSSRRRQDPDVPVKDVQLDDGSLQSSNNRQPEVRGRDSSVRRRDSGQHSGKSETAATAAVAAAAEEEDSLSLISALSRNSSVETLASEPWLRPGTSSAVKRSAWRERANGSEERPAWLRHHIA